MKKGTVEPKKSPGFIKGLFCEPDASPSFSRVVTAIFVAAVIVWTSHIVFTLHRMPDLTTPSLIIGALYGVNKIANAATAFAGDKKDAPK